MRSNAPKLLARCVLALILAMSGCGPASNVALKVATDMAAGAARSGCYGGCGKGLECDRKTGLCKEVEIPRAAPGEDTPIAKSSPSAKPAGTSALTTFAPPVLNVPPPPPPK